MFEEIRIENLGVIESATLDLSPGLTVITGETGAGKTMVLTGLGLLLGAKADPSVVREKSNGTVVEGRVVVATHDSVVAMVEDAGGTLDEDVLTLMRTITGESGRSRAFIGGRSVPQAVLSELGERLVTVHGQSDQIQLKSAARQRETLDEYGGAPAATCRANYRRVYYELQEATRELTELRDSRTQREVEAEILREGLAEIEGAELQAGEDDQLHVDIERLANVEDLRAAVSDGHNRISGEFAADDSTKAVGLVTEAGKSIEGAASRDPQLKGLADRLTEAAYSLTDIGSELASYLAGLEADPLRLEQLQERRAVINSLLRKYGPTLEDVLTWAQRASERLTVLSTDDELINELVERVTALETEINIRAKELTEIRMTSAAALASRATAELAGLAMPESQLVISVTILNECGPWGQDDIEFLLVPHTGAQPRPLGKGASGGELSRIMLALEVALASVGHSDGAAKTFVFDEVDAGVGGSAAIEVGRRLAELARTQQVLVVTHLAQVAAFADQHLRVHKQRDPNASITATDVTTVEADDRLAELARMLGGNDSAAARLHASELLETASQRMRG